jgi:myo-inositol 2-dehydrogenase/D-chiro-inositol 1-dehydrogenase
MDVDQTRAEAVASACGDARVFTDASALIEDIGVEAVLIAAPDPTHAELTVACIGAGKPVLCEKPLATSVDEAEKVLHTELTGGRRLVQVGFMREYDPAHKRVKKVIERGDIGRPLLFRGVHNNLGIGSERTTEDVIVNSAIHDIHSARWMLGAEIASVYVQRIAAVQERPETCRLLLVQMTLRNGSLAIIELNADSGYGYEVDVEVSGELGSVRTTALRSPMVRHSGTQSQRIEPDWLERFDTAYLDEVQAWVRSLLDEEPTGPSVRDGYLSLVVADACLRSAEIGLPQEVPVIERPALYEPPLA